MVAAGDVVFRGGVAFVLLVKMRDGTWAASDEDGKWHIIHP